MTLAWVIGCGGLLGAALCRTLAHRGHVLFSPPERFAWHDESVLAAQIETAVASFLHQARTADRWQIYWAAGIGTMSSSAELLAPETRALKFFLQCLTTDSQRLSIAGSIAFASSAGAIYAGSHDDLITEATATAPTTAYAREKLQQEAVLEAWCLTMSNMSCLIARLSTLYGSGQATGKAQGLLTHIARRILRNQPIQIYVPFDTIRDYLSADDAADALVNMLGLASEKPGSCLQIIASEQPTTIAEIISIFRRLARRAPRIVTSASQLSSLYARRVQFRSLRGLEPLRPVMRNLSVGIARLMREERTNFARNGDH